LFYSVEQKEIGISVLTFSDGSDSGGGTFALLASPSAEVAKEKIVRKDVVFVLDTSGSMAQNDKLEQAKKALFFCLKNLNTGDRFELVRFSTEAESLFGKLAEVNEVNRQKAEGFVKELRPIGGTAIEEALAKALKPAETRPEKTRPYVIVFLTDGKPTIGKTDERELLAGVEKAIGDRTIRIFCFGIGADVNTHLLDGIAEKTRAASQYVLPAEDLEIKVSSFYTKINDPVLSDLKLSFSGAVRFSKMHPSALPDLFKGDQLMVFGRYNGAGDAAIKLEGMINGVRRIFTYEANFPARATEHTFLPKLWATRRVGFLLDQIRLHSEEKELKDEIVDLARKYGIVTPYTAYLVVEDESRRNIVAERRTIQSFQAMPAAQAASSAMYRDARLKNSGEAAVGGAQAIDTMNRADNMAAIAKANDLALRGQVGELKESAKTIKIAIQNQQTRSIRGRTFYQNGSQWVDSLAQTKQNARRQQVKFNSEAYFDLMRKYKDAAQWFSVGRNVQVFIEDTLYEIVD
jgi:Ca-activated chloride channel family protein